MSPRPDTHSPDTTGPGADWLDVDCLAQRVHQLPALPEVVVELLQVLRNEDLSVQRCISLIERDPALAGRTLRLANSAFYGVPGRVGSIGDAVRLLGLRTVSSVLTAVALQGTLGVQGCAGFSLQQHWQQAIGTALAARCLAPASGVEVDEAFLAGLLQDSGQLVLAVLAPQQTARTLAWAQAHGGPLEQAEQALLGVAHPQLGALLVRHWRLPETMAQAIAQHHAPTPAAPGQPTGLAVVLQQADALVRSLLQPAAAEAAGPALPLDPAELLRVQQAVGLGMREFSAALQLH